MIDASAGRRRRAQTGIATDDATPFRLAITRYTADLAALGKTSDTFEFFLAFAGEVTDRYGRLL